MSQPKNLHLNLIHTGRGKAGKWGSADEDSWDAGIFNHISFKSIDLLFPCREVEAVKGWRSNEGVKGRAPR